MPLRDHFRPPLHNETSWESFHAMWPTYLVAALNRTLPSRFVAGARVHHGAFIEVDVAAFEKSETVGAAWNQPQNGSVTVATWVPPQARISREKDLLDQDEYEVRIFDNERNRRLVAAVEIVSPANKDRAEHRHTFIAKCAGLLKNQVTVAIVDVVDVRRFNLYAELLEFLGEADPEMSAESPAMYASICRMARRREVWNLETWAYPLEFGRILPILPLWLADDFAVPLELEATYEETCRSLRIS